ncbi:MAG: UvrD-helicase domain-containing protein [Flavobacteriaceae bacterium]|jgi:exodeoxyribonuclease V beta subunit|nr:UvrD-helicase domain-containing protein [Flavobacteriaceae bacterium]
MPIIQNPQDFNVISVPLKGKNLIEASAGTGKTYSLAVMAVRLIIEQGLPVSKILMVTFTEKAVAELQLRVRQFIRDAYKYSLDNKNLTDQTLCTIVDNNTEAKTHLSKAILELDELNIYTIHSFCQQTLTEYAFHTNEAFDKELVTDLTDYMERFVQRFLREQLYPLSMNQLEDIKDVFGDIYNLDIYYKLLQESKLCTIHNFDQLIDYYTNTIIQTNKKLEERIHMLQSNNSYRFVYDMLYAMTQDTRLQTQLKQANIFSFDDLLINLSNNIGEELIHLFETKYNVLFIDEFQDTDAIQYGIFSTLFRAQTTFYIGDPKQSIYKFRNADIHTYFKAKSEVDQLYSLPQNYRSAPALVAAVNDLFDDRHFIGAENAFGFPMTNPQIQHLPIQAFQKFQDYLTYNNQRIEKPFYINTIEKNTFPMAENILSFLTHAQHNGQAILPNQIAFIARNNDELRLMKRLLAEKKVPAVILQEERIFQTEESLFIAQVLKAIHTRSTKHITQVLAHRVFNKSLNQLPFIDYTACIELFYSYNETIYTKGIYEVLMHFFNDFNLEALINKNIKNNIQFWANLNQISEQLQHIQTQEKRSLEDIISHLDKNTIGQEDKYQTRIESDEKAVQLLTIHKSKGLEFDYVFTGDLNTGKRTSITGIFKYYNPINQSYIADLSLQNIGYYNEYYQQSEEQEKRRALYVLFTRAKYGIFCYSEEKRNGGTLSKFIGQNTSSYLSYNFPFIPVAGTYHRTTEEELLIKETQLTVTDKDWKKISYSYLSGTYSHYPPANTIRNTTAYDQFIFEDLTKGITTGNLIHNLFEYLDFTNPKQWNQVIEHSIAQYAPAKSKQYQEILSEFVSHILTTTIEIENTVLQLDKIPTNKKVNELEFDFMVQNIQLDRFKYIENKAVQISYIDTPQLYGILNGLIDLVFEWEGKYYILDWKTNHLGNRCEDYTTHKLQEAMTGNNYHLQYCIYTVALTKFLRSKIPNFDYDTHVGGVIYLFVRGMRKGQDTGIFTNRLSKEDVITLENLFH